jgi:hypothetical protein
VPGWTDPRDDARHVTWVHVFDAEGTAFPRTVDALPGAERRAS